MSNAAHSPNQTPNQPIVATRRTTETKPSFKTTEFYIWLLVSAGILIAAAVTDNGDDGQGFGADHAWMYVAFVTVGYLVSRGLAKSGSRANDDSSK
ncbi:hypothetical protein [Marisediminicola sp. LYQ134]|uniref:hypothetical protein n=1 Tax=unclassified Marisediminicola TaxID=2618316 RepID=UPI0039835F40